MTTPTSTSEPKRLREESDSSLERALLGAGSSSPSSSQTRAKVLAGLGLAGSASLLAGSAAASVTSTAKLTLTKLLLGVSLVGATAVPVGYYAYQRATAPAAPETAQPAEANTPAAKLLADELDALDRARLSLAEGEARRALANLDAYERAFPGGRLQLEAEVLRIDALAKLGRKEAARERAESFLRRHPNSVLATRVRALVAD
jgi:hypothetical protein